MADQASPENLGEVREELLSRLRRAEGQLRGIQKMILDGRECQEILIQLAAVKAAVVQAGMTILSTQLTRCFQGGDAGKDELAKFMEIFRKFS